MPTETIVESMRRCLLLLFCPWFKRPNIRRHKSFLSLGYNCELAFRYNLTNKFVESGLFQWGYSHSVEELTYALSHLNLLYTGKVLDPNPLYECANTHIRQHGKAPMHLWMTGGAASLIESDKADLIGRMTHLKEKFVACLRRGGALVMYKMRTSEALAEDAQEKVGGILAALRNLGARDFDFLLVLEERCRDKALISEKTEERFFIRFVREFNPEEKVTGAKLGDPRGWKRIFKEFRPECRQKKTHKFKFEK